MSSSDYSRIQKSDHVYLPCLRVIGLHHHEEHGGACQVDDLLDPLRRHRRPGVQRDRYNHSLLQLQPLCLPSGVLPAPN